MSKKLLYSVGVTHEGETHWFTPDSDVPSWAVKLINPERFGASEGESDPTPAPEPEPAVVPPPPRSGKGSGIAQWAKYADAHDVEVPDDAGRDDIIAALEAAGVATGASEGESDPNEPAPEPAGT